jgi:hypothetical protein
MLENPQGKSFILAPASDFDRTSNLSGTIGDIGDRHQISSIDEKNFKSLTSRTAVIKSGKLIGHGILINEGPSAALLTAAHVHTQLCEMDTSATMTLPNLEGTPTFTLDCRQGKLIDEEIDLLIWPVKLPDAILENLPALELAPFDENKPSRGVTLCLTLKWMPHPYELSLHDGGTYLHSQSLAMPGCSGSGLFAGNTLIGIFKGFLWEPRISIFEKLDANIITKINIILAGEFMLNGFQLASTSRGDPLDGGTGARFASLHFFPTFQNNRFPMLMPAETLVKIPEEFTADKGILASESETFFDPETGTVTSRDIMAPEKKLEKSANFWPVSLTKVMYPFEERGSNFRKKNSIKQRQRYFFLWEGGLGQEILEISGKGNERVKVSWASPSEERRPGHYWTTFNTALDEKSYFGTQIVDANVFRTNHPDKNPFRLQMVSLSTEEGLDESIMGVDSLPNLDRWTLNLRPGKVTLHDPRASQKEIILNDPNIAFRSFMLASIMNKDEVIVYNVGLHLKATPGSETRAEMTVHRVVAPTLNHVWMGVFTSFQILSFESWTE